MSTAHDDVRADAMGMPSGFRPVLLLSIGASIVATLPMLLIGPLALQLERELGLGAAAIGSAVGIATVVRALTTAVAGSVVDRQGATRSLRVALVASALACVGLAVTARSWIVLVAWLSLAGISHAVALPAVNRLMVGRVAASRLGLAFGIKMIGPPIASLLAGLSVPLLVVHIGWRPTYLIAGAIGVVTILAVRLVGVERPPVSEVRRIRGDRFPGAGARALVGIGVVAEFVASGSVLTFFVTSAYRAGVGEGPAATALAVASLLALLTRIAGGHVCDVTRIHPLRLSSAMFVVSASGLGLLATGRPTLMVVGMFVGLIAVWGFTNMTWIALMRSFPKQPGRATGSMAWAILVGGGLGPIAFGTLVEVAGYAQAWTMAAVVALIGCGANLIAARLLPFAVAAPPDPGPEQERPRLEAGQTR